MTPEQAEKALKAHPTTVRAFYATGRAHTRAEGVLIGYTLEPTAIIQLPDGTNEHWLMRLTEETP